MKNRAIPSWFLAVALLLFCIASAHGQSLPEREAKKYNYVGPVSEGLVLVHKGGQAANPKLGRYNTDGRYGFTDTSGRVVVEPVYDYARDFEEGLAVVGRGKGEERRFGAIDRTGREVIACAWDDVSDCADGRCRVQLGLGVQRRYGFADSSGRMVVPVGYDYAMPFSEGAAAVGTGRWVERRIEPGRVPPKDGNVEFSGKFGFIDTDGGLLTEIVYDDASSFSEGRAAVGRMGKYYVKWGYIDAAGKEVIPFDYFGAESFHDGLAVVSRISGGVPKYGYIDTAGREVIPCRFDTAQPYRNGSMWVGEGTYPDCAYSLLGPDGQPLIDFKVYELNASGVGGIASAAVPDANGTLRFGVLDAKGCIVVPFEYDDVTIFTEWDPTTQSYVSRGLAVLDGKNRPFSLHRGKR